MGMGTITARIKKRTGKEVFQATVRPPGHRSLSQTFDTRAEADEFLKKMAPKLKALNEANRASQGSAQALRLKNPTQADFNEEVLGDTLDLYSKSIRCSESDKRRIIGAKKLIGDVTLGGLDPAWVENYITVAVKTPTNRKVCYCLSTIESHMGVIQRACRWRAKQMKLAPFFLPFSTAENFPPNWRHKRTRRLTDEEEQRVREHFESSEHHSSEQWVLLFLLAMETGARLQELVLAKASEFNVKTRVWMMPAVHTKKKTLRAVSLTPKAGKIVERMLELAHPLDDRLFHAIPNPSAASQRFHKAIQELGIENLIFHDTRHEGISRLVEEQRDVRVYEIMQMVGHKSIQQLIDYTHLRADEISARMK